MSIDTKLQQCTIPFKDFLLKDLAEPEFAKGYLETALQDFYVDGNLEIMVLVIKILHKHRAVLKTLQSGHASARTHSPIF